MRNHHLTLPYKVLLALAIVVAGLTPTAVGASGGGADTVPSGSLGGLRYHVVAPGDTVVSIARTYGVDPDVLRATNGLVGDRLYLGARVLIDPANSAAATTSTTATAAASTGAATATAATSSGGITYVVQQGDTLEQIARRQGVTLANLLAANGLSASKVILPGQQLTIPTPGSAAAATSSSASSSTGGSASGGTYVVKEGDVLERIARRQGITLSNLLKANGLSSDSVIQPGQRLTIPAAGGGSAAPAASTDSGTYVVKEGDVLERIARHHGVKLSALLSANGLNATSLILPGKVLVVPAGGSSSGSGSSSAAVGTTSGGSSSSSSSSGWVGPRIVCPVPGASYMNDWGFPRGSERFHEGTDMFAPAGTTIVAPVSGTLVFGSNGFGGTTFTITSPDGWVVYGAHLSDTIGSSGQVAAGTPVGRVGSSGNAAGGDPHLHLSIKPAGGRAANPYPSVVAACG